MSQQAPKGSFVQTLLIAAVIFLGFQLFFGNKQAPDSREPAKIMADMTKEVNEIKSDALERKVPIAQILQERGAKGRLDVKTDHPTLNLDQQRQQLLYQNELILDQTTSLQVGNVVNRIEDAKIAQAEKDRRIVEARIIAADTALKAAKQRNEFDRLVTAAESFSQLSRNYAGTEVWNQTMQVGDASYSAASMEKLLQDTSTDLGKNVPVWGFFPGYQFIDFLVHLTGAVPAFSYAFAGLLLAIFVRALIWPLAQRQMMFGRQMSQLAPLVNEIKEQYKGKPPQQQQEMNMKVMGLYKEYGVNPMAGCFPALLQMPLFLLIYTSMLHYRFEFQKGTFLWINPGLSEATNGFIAANLGQKDYILIVLYGISMLGTTLLMPISDPANARQQRTMGIVMSLFFAVLMFFWPVPSAFVLYWVFTNLLATGQSLRAYRLPLPPLVKKNAPSGGVYVKDSDAPGTNGSINGKAKSTGVPRRHKPKKK